MFGLRPVELTAADRLRAAGHPVRVLDPFGGAVADGPDGAPTFEAGFAILDRVGWDTIMARAEDALRDLPPETVLIGFSMGVGVVANLWSRRLEAAAVLLLHATCYLYPGAGHYFTDRSLPDYDATATALTWRRVEALLRTLPGPVG